MCATQFKGAPQLKKIEIMECPYCGYKNASDKYCPDCQRTFGVEDIEREKLRRCFSSLLMHTNENEPQTCDITIDGNGFGLSTNDMLTIDKMFQFEDGTIWFHFYGADDYTDFDDIAVEDLKKIYAEVSN